MIRFRIAPYLLLILAAAVSTPEAKRASKHPKKAPQGRDCKAMTDSLVRLYQNDDPAYLTWDFSGAGCDSARLYTVYYHQGIGFLFISAWKEALYFLTKARDIGGPMDEEIYYHLWIVYRQLERRQEMERVTLELHQRNANSLFLMEIMDQWKTVNSPHRKVSWVFSSKAAWAHSPFLNHTFTNRIRGETGQRRGSHRFGESASLSLKSQWDQRLLQGFQANVGGEYAHGNLSLEGNWGLSYESRRADSSSAFISDGERSFLLDPDWNFSQGRVALGYSRTTAAGWNVGWSGSLHQISPDWRVAGLNHTQSFLFPEFILVGFVDFQRHWISAAGGDSLAAAVIGELDGMHAFSANLSPYFTRGRHSLGAGPTYYAARWRYDGAADGDAEWQHSLAGTASYSFDWRAWCRLALNASYGIEWNNTLENPSYRSRKVHGLDLGFSLSY
jgi:hypothetical protein